MTIKKIKIENIKGISNRIFELNILPNRPSLLVAPNGFGKSSFASAFLSLKTNKLSVNEDHYHKNDSTLISKLTIEYEYFNNIVHTLEADGATNTISQHFSWFVINNQIKAKGVGRNFRGHTAVSASIAIESITLIDTIPEKESFDYSYRVQKTEFGCNGRVLPNISSYFDDLHFIKRLELKFEQLDRISQRRSQRKIEDFIESVNAKTGNVNQLRQWICDNNKIDELITIEELNEISNLIKDSNLGVNNLELSFLTALQLYRVYEKDKQKFKKAVKYSSYKLEKKEYEEMLKAFNGNLWCEVSPKEQGRKLVVEFPNAKHISNGQRDVITFIALLYRAQKKLTKKYCILVIDEVFDYLDDANLVSVQYYITKLIDEYKEKGRRLYPLILTHLNPNYFKNFTFSKQKIYYLDKKDIQPNPHMVNLLKNRNHESIKDDVSKFLLHYHQEQINKRIEFRELSLPETWGEGDNFQNFISEEARKYLETGEGFDPLAVCCAVRKSVEERAYQLLAEENHKQEFIKTFYTRDKLSYAEGLGVPIPEYFYLLGVIYNDAMHLRDGQDNISPIAAKLENQIIRGLIRKVLQPPNA